MCSTPPAFTESLMICFQVRSVWCHSTLSLMKNLRWKKFWTHKCKKTVLFTVLNELISMNTPESSSQISSVVMMHLNISITVTWTNLKKLTDVLCLSLMKTVNFSHNCFSSKFWTHRLLLHNLKFLMQHLCLNIHNCHFTYMMHTVCSVEKSWTYTSWPELTLNIRDFNNFQLFYVSQCCLPLLPATVVCHQASLLLFLLTSLSDSDWFLLFSISSSSELNEKGFWERSNVMM